MSLVVNSAVMVLDVRHHLRHETVLYPAHHGASSRCFLIDISIRHHHYHRYGISALNHAIHFMNKISVFNP